MLFRFIKKTPKVSFVENRKKFYILSLSFAIISIFSLWIKALNFGIDFKTCINDKNIEDFVLEDRIEGVKKYNVNATPTIIINGEKFEKPLTYKNLEKTLEKLL